VPDLDVVIPVYDEGEHFLRVLAALRDRVTTSFRVLVCHDFAEDTTLTAIRHASIPLPPIELVRSRGRGPHAAVMAGFRASTAPAVMVFPGDDDYNAGIVDAMVAKLREGCDLVAASRFMPGGCMVGCRWQKAIPVRLTAFVMHRLARVPTHDPSNGFRLFSRRLLEAVPIESREGFTYSIELLVKCHRLGWRIGEVPAQWFERKEGHGRFRVLGWSAAYLRWVLYAFATTWLGRRLPARVETEAC
jgi:glycosyltransferase involved in cell wall biosynthesis